MGDDGLADIGLPDADGGDAVARHAGRVDQAVGDGEGADGGRQVAAVAAPVDEGLVDGDLAEQVVDVVAGRLLLPMMTVLLVLEVAPMPSICLP